MNILQTHPRTELVMKARCEIKTAIFAAIARHGLTFVESTSVITGALQVLAHGALRQERHHSSDKGADEA